MPLDFVRCIIFVLLLLFSDVSKQFQIIYFKNRFSGACLDLRKKQWKVEETV
jgi:hypothetical protein